MGRLDDKKGTGGDLKGKKGSGGKSWTQRNYRKLHEEDWQSKIESQLIKLRSGYPRYLGFKGIYLILPTSETSGPVMLLGSGAHYSISSFT
jgi:hypothetical protein